MQVLVYGGDIRFMSLFSSQSTMVVSLEKQEERREALVNRNQDVVNLLISNIRIKERRMFTGV